jgi:tetraacyldisaccharide 4'-kinase
LKRRWYESPHPIGWLLPFAWLFAAGAGLRRSWLAPRVRRLPVPVVVIGNLTVGGSGKTPMVLWTVAALRQAGFRPGVISRGYGGNAAHYPLRVDARTDPQHCGDEALLIARRAQCPVAVAPDRVAAAELLCREDAIDVLVSDDGLQHYRLPRQLEICVIDAARGLGNRALLPAGPLREAPQRLAEVGAVVVNGAALPWLPNALVMHLQGREALRLSDAQRRPLSEFVGQALHAVAGIGDPPRFFAMLQAAGLSIHEHAFADHHAYVAGDLDFGDASPVLMTEKDAVKCERFAKPWHWYVPVAAEFSASDAARMQQLLIHLRSVR